MVSWLPPQRRYLSQAIFFHIYISGIGLLERTAPGPPPLFKKNKYKPIQAAIRKLQQLG
jgi:hypothetical protein